MKKPILWLVTSVIAIVLGGYATIRGAPKSDDAGARTARDDDQNLSSKVGEHPTPHSVAAADIKKKTGSSHGIASFYGVNTNGTRTASGVPLKDSVSTAAHRTLPFGTSVRVTNLNNALRETVKITDRGPYIKGRIIDLSRNAAKKLDMIEAGIIPVEIVVLPKVPEPIRPSLAKE